jgi:homoserine O-succinyltransferase/O-acetyltransferase
MSKARLAILDLYDGTPNQGMRCIKDIVDSFEGQVTYQVFDVRGKAEVPDLGFDFYISTGGPGDPRVGDGHWDEKYFAWLQAIWTWNQQEEAKKPVFFICHSFQMAVGFFNLAVVSERKSMSFGTFPVHLTDAGVREPVFDGLNNPFWAADFRSYQVTMPNEARFDELGAELLAIEKIRPHVPLERALMAIRFSPEMLGVQFHPEADPEGMIAHFIDPERREAIIEEHGAEKYHRLLADMRHPKRIIHTYSRVLPQFIAQSLAVIHGEGVLV